MRLAGQGMDGASKQPIHRQREFQDQYADRSLQVTEVAARQFLSQSLYPTFSAEDRTTIAEEVLALCR